MDKVGDGRIALGMGIKPITVSRYDSPNEMWLYRPYNGNLYANGVKTTTVSQATEGDVVKFDLDCVAGTLTIAINGKDLVSMHVALLYY